MTASLRHLLPPAAAAVVLGAAAGSFQPAAAQESDIQLPSTVAWTAYDVGSAGYSQAVAIGNALKNRLNVNLRVLPGKNDISRMVPLREDRVHFSAMGLATYFAQEGVFEFAAPDWGPQPIRMLLISNPAATLSIGTAKDANIETLRDLKGKRVAWVVGAPALNENISALLTFAGLTWDDVERVEFGGFGAAWEGLVNNQADAAWASTTSGMAYQLESSPRGLHWPPVPHDDEEGWARLREIAPYFYPNNGTVGAGLSEENPHEGASYPYPILIAYEGQDPDLVYNMTKAMVEFFDDYEDGAPGADGWALDRQIWEWVVPFHEGAIRYFQETGAWDDEKQAHNDRLIERQRVLQQAWDDFTAQTDATGEEFQQAWMKARAEALNDAGFDPVWTG
ncbi:MAG TPA: TAXI family TRAP transporter solute-binding subunit [Geminicoccaceae bacterium]|nr:TAXI family TRAP transporter solute-binding subunit [Geminicoccaceae bacterium]